jgi:DDE superfamily endonuclease
MHIGKQCLKAIDPLEMQKHVLLSSAMSLQHLEHRWLEVVVDGDAGHPSPKLKGMALAQQKGALFVGPGSIPQTSPPKSGAARRILQRVEFHYTPKHGSWLNMAEIEISMFARGCLSRRVASMQDLRQRIAAPSPGALLPMTRVPSSMISILSSKTNWTDQ